MVMVELGRIKPNNSAVSFWNRPFIGCSLPSFFFFPTQKTSFSVLLLCVWRPETRRRRKEMNIHKVQTRFMFFFFLLYFGGDWKIVGNASYFGEFLMLNDSYVFHFKFKSFSSHIAQFSSILPTFFTNCSLPSTCSSVLFTNCSVLLNTFQFFLNIAEFCSHIAQFHSLIALFICISPTFPLVSF